MHRNWKKILLFLKNWGSVTPFSIKFFKIPNNSKNLFHGSKRKVLKMIFRNFDRSDTILLEEAEESLRGGCGCIPPCILILFGVKVPVSLLIWTKNFYQQNPPGTLKVVWILLKPTEIAQKIDLLIKVPDVAPATVEKMRSLQMCRIKKNNTI